MQKNKYYGQIAFGNECEIKYTITKKRIKNLILKLSDDGNVLISAPHAVSISDIENFILSKQYWIAKQYALRDERIIIPSGENFALARKKFELSLTKIINTCTDIILPRPELKVKRIKSFWGKCDITRQIVTLNSALYHLDTELLDYVSLHEYVHFVHHFHDKAFWSKVESYMPNAQIYRKELKKYRL